jgi:TPR repeat protein
MTNEAALPQPTSPNDRAELIANPAPAAIPALPVRTDSLALASATAQPKAAQSNLSTENIAALVARGDAFVVAGDISSARLLYERAVEAGDGRAALRMGATFDPAFLDQVNIRGAFGDQRQALSWYRRARDLGQAEAERRLNEPKPQ